MLTRIAFILLAGLCSITTWAQPSWKRIGDITEARFLFRSYPISPNEVLVIGGHPVGISVLGASATCDILDVDTRRIVPGPQMNVPHASYASVRMPDGSIVVIGGITGQHLVATDVIERFDPILRTWTIVGHMQGQRMHMAAVALDSHRILIAGGRMSVTLEVVRSCEIFDLRTGKSIQAPALPVPMADGSLERAKTGDILAFGGRSGGAGSDRYATVYRLDTASTRWKAAGDFPTPMVTGAAATLANGELMVVGGSYLETNDNSDGNLMSDGVFRWNGDVFDSIGRMQHARILHGVVQYDDSTLLVVGGKIPPRTSTRTCEWINVRTGRSMPGPEMSLDRAFISLIGVMRNGKARVFAIGGMTASNDVATAVVEELVESCAPGDGIVFDDRDVRTAGSARSHNDEGVVLTEPEPYTAGSVWSRSQINVTGGFTASFTFRMTDGNDNDQPDGSYPGADGIAFVIQNAGPTVVGRSGEGIGYAGIPKALAVEFDTYSNPAYSDPNGNHVAVQSGGQGPCRSEHVAPYNLGITTDIVTMIPDGRIYHGRIDYQGNRLSIYLDTTGRFERPVLVVDNLDISNLLGLDSRGASWIGFTSATGKSVERHELLTWTIDGCASLVTSVQDEGMPDRSTAGHIYIAPMPSHGSARLVAAAMDFGESVHVTFTDLAGTTLGMTTMHGAELRRGVDLPFQPPTGSYYVHVTDGTRSVVLPWIVIR